MINYVSGEIVDIENNTAVVECNGIGYELVCSIYTLSTLSIGSKTRLLSYLQVREDGMTLFGFSTKEEKNLFLLLTSVSGIGPKMAITVLSGIDTNSLALAIFNGDTKALTNIKGLGKKTAERIVLELKEKVQVDANAAVLPIETNDNIKLTKDMVDAIAVLCSLGKSQSDAEKLVDASSKLGATTAEELINMAFRIN